MENQRLVDQFNKNSVEMVKVHLQEWKSQAYFDVRVWYSENPGENGAERPTHKGITLNVELLPQLITALQKTQEETDKEAEPKPESAQEGRSPQSEGADMGDSS